MSPNNDQNGLRIGIIGTGPVGLILAVHLKEAGAFVVPCDIFPNKTEQIKKRGVTLTHTFDKHVDITAACQTVQELAMYDLNVIIIAVKTPDLSKVLDQIAEIDKGDLHILCAQNGIDNEVEIGQRFGDHRTLRMVVNFAGNLANDHTVHVSFFNPPNYLAAMADGGNEMAQRIADMLSSVNLATEIPVDIQDHIWEKAILNASLSPICAITHRTVKEVMDFPKTLELAEGIIDESVRVAEMERIELGNKFRRFCIRYLKNAGHHKPSMLVDLENGDPTEIDQLNGRIVQYGHKHCLPTPLNRSVTALVHLLEHTRR